MAKTWELSALPPPPERFGPVPSPGVAGVICPHDDYLYAGRVYRATLPLVTARRVVVVGVFHRYAKFGIRDRLVFDAYRAWRAPDGEVPVSSLRADALSKMLSDDVLQSTDAHDTEHSVEALVYWLRHARPDVEIMPVLVPAMSFERMQELAQRLGAVLAEAMRSHGWTLGRDVAVAISADGIHYGSDFEEVPFGPGGADAYQQATARDRALLTGPLSGRVTREKMSELYSTFVDPAHPDTYRVTWCGRFSIPFGGLLLRELGERTAAASVISHPVAYATSVGWPELGLRDVGLGPTAPASLYHFVSYPAVAFTMEPALQAP